MIFTETTFGPFATLGSGWRFRKDFAVTAVAPPHKQATKLPGHRAAEKPHNYLFNKTDASFAK
jgi:hypothetical protein